MNTQTKTHNGKPPSKEAEPLCVFYFLQDHPSHLMGTVFHLLKNHLRKLLNQYTVHNEALMKNVCFGADAKFSQMFHFTNLIHTFAKNKAKRPFGL